MHHERRSVEPAAILIFADSQQRDLRRRALPSSASPLLALPRLDRAGLPADVHWFTDRPSPFAGGVPVHRQRGKSFGERLGNAVADLAAMGYRQVVIVGRDCPQLSPADITAALQLLTAGRRLVIGPDHRGGCWLIALNVADRMLLSGIRWQRDTDAAELLARVDPAAAGLLDTRFDLDTLDDLRRIARQFLPAGYILHGIGFGDAVDSAFLATDALRRIAFQTPPPVAHRRRCA